MTVASGPAIDTSVAIPLLAASHRSHSQIVSWAGGKALCLAGHALPETFAVLTRLPGDARVDAADAVTLIDENFAEPLLLSEEMARGAHRRLAGIGVVGGAVYDGLVALAAAEHGVPLATRDARARSTYEAVGVEVVLIPAEPEGGGSRPQRGP